MDTRRLFQLVSTFAILAVAATLPIGCAAVVPDPVIDSESASTKGKQTAVLAGGCFWCTEAVLEELIGVHNVVSGYAGGEAAKAKYDLVARGSTNHAEAIKITFDPAKISYGQLLQVFFSAAHDPTQLNRQGPDHGRQYRSAIFWQDAEQKRIAEAYIQQLNEAKVFSKPIVTEVVELEKFYTAEPYHQDFVKLHPRHMYVVVNALPKLKKLSKEFPALVKK